ncbi:hypothetical protein ACP4OV_025282 [Aristida adscensionis]
MKIRECVHLQYVSTSTSMKIELTSSQIHTTGGKFASTTMSCTSISVFFVAALLLLPARCASDDRLLPGKPLSPGAAIISGGGVFAMGFFSPSNSAPEKLYLGIWYNNIPSLTVVWVANRATPATAASAPSLAVTNTSNLVLSDGNGRVLWTSGGAATAVASSPPPPPMSSSSGPPVAVLMDTGNLVLRSWDGTTAWQSFDHPADTLLPGMKMRRSQRAGDGGGGGGRLVSWNGPDDPSPGAFSFGVDAGDFAQGFILNGSDPVWRSTVWTGNAVSSHLFQGANASFAVYLAYVDAADEMSMVFTVPAGAPALRFVMSYSGKLEISSWSSTAASPSPAGWTTVTAWPEDGGCSRYGHCGPAGYCDHADAPPSCKCLDGFEPADKAEWRSGRFARGCRRRRAAPPRCGDGGGFVALPGMQVPDGFVRVRGKASLRECAAACGGNCSCVAYAYASFNGGSASSRDGMSAAATCLVWIGDQQLVDAQKIGGTAGADDIQETLYLRAAGMAAERTKASAVKTILPILGGATLEGGQEVAIKRLSRDSNQGIEEFRNEVILIAKLQHRNLVRLLGCCVERDEKLLIYEYLPNKSLDAVIFQCAENAAIDWPTRLQIIKGVAKGLLYLHHDSRLTIIHRDLKASNVLLDVEMRPKIADFGMARTFGDKQQDANTKRVVGTYGYMAPEYAMEGIFSVKSDVYSFGVLLLEVVSGIKISSVDRIMGYPNLIVCMEPLEGREGKGFDR